MAQPLRFLTSTILHVLQLLLTQKCAPWSLRRDCGPSQCVLCVDHEGQIHCLQSDFFQVPMTLSKEEKPPPIKPNNLNQPQQKKE